MTSQKLNSLQMGRGLAAFAVAAFHLSLLMGDPRYGGEKVFAFFTNEWRRGVDFFFVLSGFIIVYAHSADIGRPSALGRYAWRRFVRLYPVYWAYTLALTLLLLAGLGQAADLPNTLLGWMNALSLIRLTPEAPPLPVAWTLFHEVGFYAAFGILILSRRWGGVLFVGWMLVCLVVLQYPPYDHRTPWLVYTAAYSLNFALGMGAWWLYAKGWGGWSTLGAGVALVAAGQAAQFAGVSTHSLVYAVAFALIVAGATVLEGRGRLRVWAPLVVLGNASYTLYLVHENVSSLILKVAFKLHLDQMIGRVGLYFLTLAAVCLAGLLAYRFVEVPLIRLCRRLAERPRGREQSAVAVVPIDRG